MVHGSLFVVMYNEKDIIIYDPLITIAYFSVASVPL